MILQSIGMAVLLVIQFFAMKIWLSGIVFPETSDDFGSDIEELEAAGVEPSSYINLTPYIALTVHALAIAAYYSLVTGGL